MGRFKQQMIEEQENERLAELHFDEIANILDADEWWREQDAEMEAKELEQIETLAEIQEYIHLGYGI